MVLLYLTHPQWADFAGCAVANRDNTVRLKGLLVMPGLTLRYLEERGYQTAGLQSQSWHDLEVFHPDRVVTVCDSAAGEICPLWMGEVEKHHWGLPDPSRVEGDEAAIRSAFMTVIDRIEDKVDEWLRECAA